MVHQVVAVPSVFEVSGNSQRDLSEKILHEEEAEKAALDADRPSKDGCLAFICGAGRSGTTLAVNLLGQHSQLAPLYETEFVTTVVQLIEGMGLSPVDEDRWTGDNPPAAALWIAGTWNGWKCNEMVWDGTEFVHFVTVNAWDEVSFQLLPENPEKDSWKRRFYPSEPDASPYIDHQVLGPNANGHNKNWTIGRHQLDAVYVRTRFKIMVAVNSEGGITSVSWRRDDGNGGTKELVKQVENVLASFSADVLQHNWNGDKSSHEVFPFGPVYWGVSAKVFSNLLLKHQPSFTADLTKGLMPLRALANYVDKIFASHAQHEKKRYVINKTPSYINVLPFMSYMYPHAKVIHCVRDLRDVCSSVIPRKFGPDTVEDTFKWWQNRVQRGRAWGKKNPDRYLEVQFETLVSHPDRELSRIFQFLGVPDEAASILTLEADIWYYGKPPIQIRTERIREGSNLKLSEQNILDKLQESWNTECRECCCPAKRGNGTGACICGGKNNQASNAGSPEVGGTGVTAPSAAAAASPTSGSTAGDDTGDASLAAASAGESLGCPTAGGAVVAADRCSAGHSGGRKDARSTAAAQDRAAGHISGMDARGGAPVSKPESCGKAAASEEHGAVILAAAPVVAPGTDSTTGGDTRGPAPVAAVAAARSSGTGVRDGVKARSGGGDVIADDGSGGTEDTRGRFASEHLTVGPRLCKAVKGGTGVGKAEACGKTAASEKHWAEAPAATDGVTPSALSDTEGSAPGRAHAAAVAATLSAGTVFGDAVKARTSGAGSAKGSTQDTGRKLEAEDLAACDRLSTGVTGGPGVSRQEADGKAAAGEVLAAGRVLGTVAKGGAGGSTADARSETVASEKRQAAATAAANAVAPTGGSPTRGSIAAVAPAAAPAATPGGGPVVGGGNVAKSRGHAAATTLPSRTEDARPGFAADGLAVGHSSDLAAHGSTGIGNEVVGGVAATHSGLHSLGPSSAGSEPCVEELVVEASSSVREVLHAEAQTSTPNESDPGLGTPPGGASSGRGRSTASYFLVGSWGDWAMEKMTAGRRRLLFHREAVVLPDGGEFQIVRDKDRSQVLYPSKRGEVKEDGGIADMGSADGCNWCINGRAGQVFRIELELGRECVGDKPPRVSWKLVRQEASLRCHLIGRHGGVLSPSPAGIQWGGDWDDFRGQWILHPLCMPPLRDEMSIWELERVEEPPGSFALRACHGHYLAVWDGPGDNLLFLEGSKDKPGTAWSITPVPGSKGEYYLASNRTKSWKNRYLASKEDPEQTLYMSPYQKEWERWRLVRASAPS